MRREIFVLTLIVSLVSFSTESYWNHVFENTLGYPDSLKRVNLNNGYFSIGTTTGELNGLGHVTPQQDIEEIKRHLHTLFTERGGAAFEYFLNNLYAEIDDFAFWGILSSKIIDEDISGPTSQAIKVIVYNTLESSPEQANQTIKDLADKIRISRETSDFDRSSILELFKTATSMIDISNSTNNDIAWIADMVAIGDEETKHNLLDALYQLGLNIHDRGGNITKIYETLQDKVTSEMIQLVPFEVLPLTQSLLFFAQMKSAGDVTTFNSMVDRIVSEIIGKEELIVNRLIDLSLETTSPSTLITADKIMNFIQVGKLHLNRSVDGLPMAEYNLRVTLMGRINDKIEVYSAVLDGLNNPFLLARFPPRILEIENFSVGDNGRSVKYNASYNSSPDPLAINLSAESQFPTDIRELFREDGYVPQDGIASTRDSFNLSLTYNNDSRVLTQGNNFTSFITRSPFL